MCIHSQNDPNLTLEGVISKILSRQMEYSAMHALAPWRLIS